MTDEENARTCKAGWLESSRELYNDACNLYEQEAISQQITGHTTQWKRHLKRCF